MAMANEYVHKLLGAEYLCRVLYEALVLIFSFFSADVVNVYANSISLEKDSTLRETD